MFDYFCDGHFISANDLDDARSACESLYGYTPGEIRPWTSDDDED